MGRWSLPKDDSKYVLSEESAEAAVRELVTYYHVDVDAIPDRKDRSAVEAALSGLVIDYRLGLLENLKDSSSGRLKVKQHLQDPPGSISEITYDKMSGKAKVASDGFDANDRYQRIYAIMGFLSGNPPEVIQALSGKDLSAAESLGMVFLLG